jgi:type III pantothenate kinase
LLLAVDIGNISTSFGVYEKNTLGPSWRISTALERTSDEYGLEVVGLLAHRGIDPRSIHGVALACVVPPLTSTWRRVCETYLSCTPLVVDAGVKTGLRIRYQDPKQVGADRVAHAVAVRALYTLPACVIDFGTATIFDAIDKNGDYLGGAIAPGIGIAADALARRAAKLPRIDLVAPPDAIGRNTIQSMQSGLIFGYVGLIEGMVSRFRKELGAATVVIATGRLAETIARETDVIEHLAPSLTLEGLRLIWEMNV